MAEEDNFVKDGRFAWFKQYLPKKAAYHFKSVYARREQETEEVMTS